MMHEHEVDKAMQYKAMEIAEQLFFNSPQGQQYMPMYRQLKAEEIKLKEKHEAFQKEFKTDFIHYLNAQ